MTAMDTHMIVELIGYFSSLLVLVSFLMTSVIRLRIVNSVGAIIFTVYATIIVLSHSAYEPLPGRD